MSKMDSLSMILDEMKFCGERLVDISVALREIFSEPEPTLESAPEPKEKPITFEELRTFLANKARARKENTAAIREILLSHGARKLSEVEEEFYAELLKEVEVLPDA